MVVSVLSAYRIIVRLFRDYIFGFSFFFGFFVLLDLRLSWIWLKYLESGCFVNYHQLVVLYPSWWPWPVPRMLHRSPWACKQNCAIRCICCWMLCRAARSPGRECRDLCTTALRIPNVSENEGILICINSMFFSKLFTLKTRG